MESGTMSRLTISLDDELHTALKETAARQGRTITSIIEESLRLRGIKSVHSARELVRKARENAAMDPEAAMDLAIEETRRERDR